MNFLSAAACLNLVTRCAPYRTLLARGTQTFFFFFFWNVSGKRSNLFYLFLTIYNWQPLNKIFYATILWVSWESAIAICVCGRTTIAKLFCVIKMHWNMLTFMFLSITNEQERTSKGRRWEVRDWKKLKGEQFEILHHLPMRVSYL